MSAIKILSIFLLSFFFVSVHADNICDNLAAHPSDSSKPNTVSGILFSELDPLPAIQACKEEIDKHPQISRYKFQLARALTKNKEYEKAIPYYISASQAGSIIAKYGLARRYFFAQGVKKDYAKALQLLDEIPNYTHSIHLRGWMYEKGLGVDKDEVKAVNFYKKATSMGNAASMNNLAIFYEKGKGGLKKDSDRAFHLWTEAAKQKNKFSYWNLCRAYQYAIGVIPDINMAKYWCKKAADKGHKSAEMAYQRLLKGYLTKEEESEKHKQKSPPKVVVKEISQGEKYKFSYGDIITVDDYNNGSYWKGVVQNKSDGRYQVKVTDVKVNGFMKMFLTAGTCTGNESLEYSSEGQYLWIPKWCVE